MYAVFPPSMAMPAMVFPADPPDASLPGPMMPYSFSAVSASIRFIAPFGSLCATSRASSACAITSTMALPIAVTSNVALFISGSLLGGVGPLHGFLCGLQILADERRQFLPHLGGNRVRPGDEGVLQRGRALARPFVRQAFDRLRDDG